MEGKYILICFIILFFFFSQWISIFSNSFTLILLQSISLNFCWTITSHRHRAICALFNFRTFSNYSFRSCYFICMGSTQGWSWLLLISSTLGRWLLTTNNNSFNSRTLYMWYNLISWLIFISRWSMRRNSTLMPNLRARIIINI